MSKNLPNMLENTIAKIREMVDSNSVIGQPITTPDGITIIPVSKISVGVGGGGSDYVSKHANKQENPFGGGAGGGVKVTPVAFLVVKRAVFACCPFLRLQIQPLTVLWSRCRICWISWQISLTPEWRKKTNKSIFLIHTIYG
jgi:sporulation protein YtfJ